jgi:hypothetical protein
LRQIEAKSVSGDYDREGGQHTETISDAFGTTEKEPQYQAPRSAWRCFRQSERLSEWPMNGKTKLKSKIRLQSVLYERNSAAQSRHTFFPIHATVPPQFTPLNLEAGTDVKSVPIRESIKNKLPLPLKFDTQDFFYIADNEIIPFCEQLDPGVGVPIGESKTLLTDVLRRSNKIWETRGTHDVLLLVFPALADQPPLAFGKAVGGLDVLGLKEGDLHIIPMLKDSARLKSLLTPCGFNSGDVSELAKYLSARGTAARDKHCAAIYYLIYRSRVLNNNRDYQAICFWTNRWLGIEAVMALMEFGYSFLIAMEEKRAIEMLIESTSQKKASEEHRAELERRIRELESQIANGQTLTSLPALIEATVVKQGDDDGLKHSYDKLNEAVAKLLQRITGATLLKWSKDKAKTVEFLSTEIADRIQKKTKARAGAREDNPSILRGNFFNCIAGDKKRSDVNASINKLIKAHQDGASFSPTIKAWVENVVKLKSDGDGEQKITASNPSSKNLARRTKQKRAPRRAVK